MKGTVGAIGIQEKKIQNKENVWSVIKHRIT